MRYERKDINNYLVQYKLQGEEDKFDRLSMYNDILFFNLSNLTGFKTKSIIIINENNTGGVMYVNPKFADKIIENLKRFNPNFKIEIGRQVTNINKKVIKISFRMFKTLMKNHILRRKSMEEILTLFNMEKQNEFEVGKQLYEMSIKNPNSSISSLMKELELKNDSLGRRAYWSYIVLEVCELRQRLRNNKKEYLLMELKIISL